MNATTVRGMRVAVCCLLTSAGHAGIPVAARATEKSPAQTVEFDNARGPVSAGKSAAILKELKSESGDIDILQKHLAIEQKINADSPLVLGNKLVLLQDGPATYQAMFAAIRKAADHINLETYIFEDDDIGTQFADLLLERQAAGVQVNLIYDSVGCLKQGDEIVRAIGSASADPQSLIFLTLPSAIDNAERQVHLTNAYYAPDPQLLTATIGPACEILIIAWLGEWQDSMASSCLRCRADPRQYRGVSPARRPLDPESPGAQGGNRVAASDRRSDHETWELYGAFLHRQPLKNRRSS